MHNPLQRDIGRGLGRQGDYLAEAEAASGDGERHDGEEGEELGAEQDLVEVGEKVTEGIRPRIDQHL